MLSVYGVDETTFVMTRWKCHSADVHVVDAKIEVTVTIYHVFHLGRKRYLRQTHLPLALQFDLIGKFRRVTATVFSG